MAESSGRGLVHRSRAYCSIYSLWMEGGPSPAAAATCGLQPACVCVRVCMCWGHISHVDLNMLDSCIMWCSYAARALRLRNADQLPLQTFYFFSPLFFKIYSLFVLPSTNQTRPERRRAATGSIWLMQWPPARRPWAIWAAGRLRLSDSWLIHPGGDGRPHLVLSAAASWPFFNSIVVLSTLGLESAGHKTESNVLTFTPQKMTPPAPDVWSHWVHDIDSILKSTLTCLSKIFV